MSSPWPPFLVWACGN